PRRTGNRCETTPTAVKTSWLAKPDALGRDRGEIQAAQRRRRQSQLQATSHRTGSRKNPAPHLRTTENRRNKQQAWRAATDSTPVAARRSFPPSTQHAAWPHRSRTKAKSARTTIAANAQAIGQLLANRFPPAESLLLR